MSEDKRVVSLVPNNKGSDLFRAKIKFLSGDELELVCGYIGHSGEFAQNMILVRDEEVVAIINSDAIAYVLTEEISNGDS